MARDGEVTREGGLKIHLDDGPGGQGFEGETTCGMHGSDYDRVEATPDPSPEPGPKMSERPLTFSKTYRATADMRREEGCEDIVKWFLVYYPNGSTEVAEMDVSKTWRCPLFGYGREGGYNAARFKSFLQRTWKEEADHEDSLRYLGAYEGPVDKVTQDRG